MTPTSATTLAADVRTGSARPARSSTTRWPRSRPRDGEHPRLPVAAARRGARRGRRGRRRGRRRQRPGTAGRRAGGAQGQSLHAGRRHDVRLQDPRGLAPPLQRHRGHRPPPRRRHRARQDEHGRVRHGQLDGELGLRGDAQPARHQQGSGGQQRWFRRSRRGWVHSARTRLGHRRVHPSARGLVRGGRDETHLRTRVAVRVGRLRQFARSDRPVCDDRRGRRVVVRRAGRSRPARQHLVAVAAGADAGDGARRGGGDPGRAVPRPDRRLRARRGGPGARGRRRAGRRRRQGGGGVGARVRVRAVGLLPDCAGGGLVEPGPLRRGPLRAARRRARTWPL